MFKSRSGNGRKLKAKPNPDTKKIIVGICAMRKKSESKPMMEILSRLKLFEYLETVIFDEEVILNEPIERWPRCDALISFHSSGFPLYKAVKYAELYKPFLVNDLKMQYHIMDRTKVYRLLQQHGIDHPRYAVLQPGERYEVEEGDDQIEIDGQLFLKPFVEKPVNADDHNIHIYFPTSLGGGAQKLFRKIGNKSSEYSSCGMLRQEQAYIYEDFMQTDGTDVKVYTLGPFYAHAEARKSPALDGKVERDDNGKEIRYPVILSANEKLIARKVCMAFKQVVCGFDLLRANGKSYVCDVNGFSFVKNSRKYYDDCGKILGNMIMRALAPQHCIPWSMMAQPEDIPIVPTTYGQMMELRCVIAIIRHGDRTPKQKMKMEVKHKKFFELFERHGGFKTGQLKLKKPRELQEVLDLARELLAQRSQYQDPEIEENCTKLEQLKTVLEMYGYFSGINRKVQLKYQPHGHASSDDAGSDSPKEPSLVVIVKWGGELTPAGRVQAEELGRAFRCLYPGGQGNYAGTEGLGLLRLHSTFRHDLKIYASDEGRVQMTAAAFAKGLLALDGDLTPILVQMVKSANTNGLLDNDSDCIEMQNKVKEKLREMFHADKEWTAEDYKQLCPTRDRSIMDSMKFVKNPFRMCIYVHQLIHQLIVKVKERMANPYDQELKLYHEESWDLVLRRWSKLEKDFRMKSGLFNISKIPDIYDCARFDLQHNQKELRSDIIEDLYTCARHLANIVIPQEYGISSPEKTGIAKSICTPLMRKVLADFRSAVHEDCENDTATRLDTRDARDVASPQRFVRTRLYFTSESHIHSLINMIKYGELLSDEDEQWGRAMQYISAIPELNYITQIVIMLYEDTKQAQDSDERYHVELHFSPGAYGCKTKSHRSNFPQGAGYRSKHMSGLQSREEIHDARKRHVSQTESPNDNQQIPRADKQCDFYVGDLNCTDYEYDRSLDDAEARDIKKLARTWMGNRSRSQVADDKRVNIPPPWSCGTGTVYNPPNSPSPSPQHDYVPAANLSPEDSIDEPQSIRKRSASLQMEASAVLPINPPPRRAWLTSDMRTVSAPSGNCWPSVGSWDDKRTSVIQEEPEPPSPLSGKRSSEEITSREIKLRSENRSQSFEDLSLGGKKRGRYPSEQFQHSFQALFGPKFKFPPPGDAPEDTLKPENNDLTIEEFCDDVNQTGGHVAVPSIRPLETLHNSMTLKSIIEFFSRHTEHSSTANSTCNSQATTSAAQNTIKADKLRCKETDKTLCKSQPIAKESPNSSLKKDNSPQMSTVECSNLEHLCIKGMKEPLVQRDQRHHSK